MPGRFNDRENGESAHFPRRHPEHQNREPRSNFWRDLESTENQSMNEEERRPRYQRRFEGSDEPGVYGPSPRHARKDQDIERSHGRYSGQEYERGVYGYENPEHERYSTPRRHDRRGQFDRDYQYDQNEQRHFNSAYQKWKSQWDRESDYGAGERHSQYEQGPYFGRGPKGYRRSDQRIEEDINERLTQHPFIDATEVEVRVQGGEVVLSGTVDDRNAKRIAEDIAESVSGVKDVQNQIRINKNFNKNG